MPQCILVPRKQNATGEMMRLQNDDKSFVTNLKDIAVFVTVSIDDYAKNGGTMDQLAIV